jgi:hypothetical protein
LTLDQSIEAIRLLIRLLPLQDLLEDAALLNLIVSSNLYSRAEVLPVSVFLPTQLKSIRYFTIF